jgi:hypothetical protein
MWGDSPSRFGPLSWQIGGHFVTDYPRRGGKKAGLTVCFWGGMLGG